MNIDRIVRVIRSRPTLMGAGVLLDIAGNGTKGGFSIKSRVGSKHFTIKNAGHAVLHQKKSHAPFGKKLGGAEVVW